MWKKTWQRDKYVISFHLHYNYLIKISYNTAKWSIFSFRIQKDYIFNLGILKKTTIIIIIHLKLCLCCRYYSILSKTYLRSKKRKLVEKIFGFRIIGGYMDKNSWIAESEALDELIAQKGCRTFQPQIFQPWTFEPWTVQPWTFEPWTFQPWTVQP